MTTRSFNASLKGFGVAPTAATVVVEKLTHGLAGKSFHLPRRAHCTSCGRELDLEGDPGVGYPAGRLTSRFILKLSRKTPRP